MSGNDRLRTAMAARQVTIEDVAARAEVDPKTVQRWLGGRTPHLRNRIAVAAMVGEDPEYLWPETDRGREEGARADDEVVATYAQRALVPGELWDQLIEYATRRIDLLGFAMLHVPEQHPSIFEAGTRVVENGGRVRIVLADPDGDQAIRRDREEQLDGGLLHRIRTSAKYLSEQLPGPPEVELRWQDAPMYCSIFRFDDQALVTPHVFGRPGWQSPLLHLRRLGPSGMFENYMQHFEDVWETARPMER